MAIVDDIFAPTITRQPFERPPQAETLWGAIPRGFIHFPVLDGVLQAKPINDDQHLRISGVLPAGFAYQFIQIACTIDQDVAASWSTVPILRCVNWVPGNAASQHMVLSSSAVNEFADNSAVEPRMILRTMQQASGFEWGRQILYQASRAAISWSFLQTNEADPAGAIGSVDFVASFLEFDLTQAQRFGVQTPVPVRGR